MNFNIFKINNTKESYYLDQICTIYSALPIVNLFTISIDFNQFQSISITFNPKFKWGLGLDRKSHILGEIGIVTIAILHFCQQMILPHLC